MLQAPLFHGSSFGLFPLEQDGLARSCVDVGGRQVFQALMVAPMIEVADERVDLRLKVSRQEVVLQQGTVLERLVPAFDLSQRLRIIGRAARMRRALAFQVLRQIPGDVGRPVVGEQPWTMAPLAGSSPEASRARSSVSRTSEAAMLEQSFQAMMYREKSSSTVDT